MLILLAPSKTMDFITPLPYNIPVEQPLYIEKSKVIARTIERLDKDALASLMKISPALVDRVQEMYAKWQPKGAKPTLYTYVGDVFKGMKANEMKKTDAQWAQSHLLIMSGLYGVLRPFDLISPYRLEMKANLRVGESKNLYDFWTNDLTRYVETHADGLVFNLSSDEYAGVVTRKLPKNVEVIFPVFYDERPSGVGRAPIYNKMMRGVLARWMIDHKAETPEAIQAFTMHGYQYDSSRSTAMQPAFYREKMTPLIF